MEQKEILEQLKESFIKGDKAEPFTTREYVEETLRIFDMLIDNVGDVHLSFDETDNAICDIVKDIFSYYKNEDDLIALIRKKREIIEQEKEANNGKTN